MYATLLAPVVAMAGFCCAMPAQRISPQPGFAGDSLGFPVELLPIQGSFLGNGDNSSRLTLPISPSQATDNRLEITFGFTDTPSRFLGGLQLAESIVMQIYYIWKDSSNLPIRNTIYERPLPFDDFYFTATPSLQPGTQLRPVDVGLASCWILIGLTEQPRWPGHALARIFDTAAGGRKLERGSLKIDNDPLVAGSVNRTSHSNPILSTATPFRMQQRWLKCFATILYNLPLPRSPTAIVTDDPLLSPKQRPHTYSWLCGMGSDRFDLKILPAANRGNPHELTWQKMFRWLLRWMIGVARGTANQLETANIEEGGVRTANLVFHLPEFVGTDPPDDEGTAAT